MNQETKTSQHDAEGSKIIRIDAVLAKCVKAKITSPVWIFTFCVQTCKYFGNKITWTPNSRKGCFAAHKPWKMSSHCNTASALSLAASLAFFLSFALFNKIQLFTIRMSVFSHFPNIHQLMACLYKVSARSCVIRSIVSTKLPFDGCFRWRWSGNVPRAWRYTHLISRFKWVEQTTDTRASLPIPIRYTGKLWSAINHPGYHNRQRLRPSEDNNLCYGEVAFCKGRQDLVVRSSQRWKNTYNKFYKRNE